MVILINLIFVYHCGFNKNISVCKDFEYLPIKIGVFFYIAIKTLTKWCACLSFCNFAIFKQMEQKLLNNNDFDIWKTNKD
jgi:hypothetical protein